MYIKGISKVVIVITILLSVFLVTPSKVEAAFDAPLTCQTDYKLASEFTGMEPYCCPNNKKFTELIMASRGDLRSINSFGNTYREFLSGPSQCKVKYTAVQKNSLLTVETVFEVTGVKPTIACPVNTCKGDPVLGFSKCFGQLEPVNSKVDSRVCCVEKKGNPGRLSTLADCKNPDLSVVPVFNQLPKEITPDEICSKDSGAGNPDDKRSSGEKGRIYGECMDCLKNKNYLWTGVGCMEASLNGVITTIIRIFYGIITAIMLLKIIIAGYKYYGGDPEQLKDSKMEIFSAIGAAFALTLGIIALRYIGIDILGLGGIDGISTGLPVLK